MAALPVVDIPAYLAYVPASLVVAGNADGTKVAASLDTQLVAALDCPPGTTLVTTTEATACPYFDEYCTPQALTFVTALYEATREELAAVLAARVADRTFIDTFTRACAADNATTGTAYQDPTFKTVIGMPDADGRVAIGPANGVDNDAWRTPQPSKPVAPLPPHLQGFHVTLFGPPDSAKMAINAMNSRLRALPDEPPVVTALVDGSDIVPKWGADDEDSTTPLVSDLISAGVHLNACFRGSLAHDDAGGRHYEITAEAGARAQPFKRVPGLGLPSTSFFVTREGEDGTLSPLPLHVWDFGLHVFHNWAHAKALTFYVPKLETEEEAAYVAHLVATAEALLAAAGKAPYTPGTIRVIVVLESPRAVFRTNAIMDALYPYFAGASLGWHDYLAATARLFKEDPAYRIPVKKDPNIVINHIKESHVFLSHLVAARGGVAIGGMYGILPSSTALDHPSMQVTLYGFVRDVVTQLRRGLTGFWLAHPLFVRLGIAVVEAWRAVDSGSSPAALRHLIGALISDHDRAAALVAFVEGSDVEGLRPDDPLYCRALLAADVNVSDVIANHDPAEVSYNVFQALQYLADWLSGNGCVALPASIMDEHVRVMDDLATTERSRWELYAEVYHGRVSLQSFLATVEEELNFIRRDHATDTKLVQVKWDPVWYPVAARVLILLVCPPPGAAPVEFATELLLPFTLPVVREARDPWAAAVAVDPAKFAVPRYVQRWRAVFQAIGSTRVASAVASAAVDSPEFLIDLVNTLSIEEVYYAGTFHGNLGMSPEEVATDGDANVRLEQAAAAASATNELQFELRALADTYAAKHGFKLLIRALGRTTQELIDLAKQRIDNPTGTELVAARQALAEIAVLRMEREGGWGSGVDRATLDAIAARHQVGHAQIAIVNRPGDGPFPILAPPNASAELIKCHSIRRLVDGSPAATEVVQTVHAGTALVDGARVLPPGTPSPKMQIASISKTFAAAFAIEYLTDRLGPGVLDMPVNDLLTAFGSPFRLEVADGEAMAAADAKRAVVDPDYFSVVELVEATGTAVHGGATPVPGVSSGAGASDTAGVGFDFGDRAAWPGRFHLRHAMDHSGLDGPYVFGLTDPREARDALALLSDPLPAAAAAAGYLPVRITKHPGLRFGYSGSGFVLLQHILEVVGGTDVATLMAPWLTALGLTRADVSFGLSAASADDAVPPGPLDDGVTTPPQMHFPPLAAGAWGSASGVAAFLVRLVNAYQDPSAGAPISHATAAAMIGDPQDRGARQFQGADCGLGLFVATAGPNRIIIHQAANEGYRGVYAVVAKGPDAGRGLVSLATGARNAACFNAEVLHVVLSALGLEGVDIAAMTGVHIGDLNLDAWPQEQVVNRTYKGLVFDHFLDDAPQTHHDPSSRFFAGGLRRPDPRASHNRAIGARLMKATSQAFAAASNLVEPTRPHFDPAAFGRQGKVMDSWETARHRLFAPPHMGGDVAAFEVAPGTNLGGVDTVVISTEYHNGNHSQAAIVQVALSDGSDGSNLDWQDLVAKTPLDGHAETWVRLPAPIDGAPNAFRLVSIPDGGISRIAFFVWDDLVKAGLIGGGNDVPSPPPDLAPGATASVAIAAAIPEAVHDQHVMCHRINHIPPPDRLAAHWASLASSADEAALVNVCAPTLGACVVHASNEHYGPADAMLASGPPLGMFDGFETKRSRSAGHVDFCVVRLAVCAPLVAIEVDCTFFKHNCPRRLSILGFSARTGWEWCAREVSFGAYRGNTMTWRPSDGLHTTSTTAFEFVAVVSHPDGGINRLRVLTTAAAAVSAYEASGVIGSADDAEAKVDRVREGILATLAEQTPARL